MKPFNTISETRHGLMVHNALDTIVCRSLMVYGEFSEIEGRVLRSLVKDGDVVIDVGANFGAHTLPLAHKVGMTGLVYAIEPQRLVFQALCGTLAINSLANVVAINAAAGARAGSIRVPVCNPWKPVNIGGLEIDNWDEGQEQPVVADDVPMIVLDQLNLPRCRLLKVDAEGMESQVLAGAESLIRTHRPVLYVENDRQDRSPELIARILSMGYRAWWHLPPLYNPDNHRGVAEDIFPGVGSSNMLATPAELPTETDLREVSGPDDWSNLG
ncbi:MAG: FkbM family methyltransferase [Alphaproteobacteria bacterium]